MHYITADGLPPVRPDVDLPLALMTRFVADCTITVTFIVTAHYRTIIFTVLHIFNIHVYIPRIVSLKTKIRLDNI